MPPAVGVDGFEVFRTKFGVCSQLCGDSTKERLVFCRSPMGTPALESNCDPVEMSNATRTETCNEESCTASEFFINLGPWGECNRSCGGGTRVRTATCLNSSTLEEAPMEACGELSELVTELECNTAPCEAFRFDISNWTDCSQECGGGFQSRRVECVSATTRSVQNDTTCLAANLTRPNDEQSCNVGRCPELVEGGGGRKLLQERSEGLCQGRTCSGKGTCNEGVCTCNDGFEGPDCQFDSREVPECPGVLEFNGTCCQSGAFSFGGECCGGENATLDRNGSCCQGELDACGECGGSGLFFDVLGQCCETILDGGGICCPSGSLDECGVCDGDGSSCRVEVSAVLETEANVRLVDIRRCLADKVAAGSAVKGKAFDVFINSQKKMKKNTRLVDFIVTGAMASTSSIRDLISTGAAGPNGASSDPCTAREIKTIRRAPTHGNNVCEIGEMPGLPGFGIKNPFKFELDCHHEVAVCPTPDSNSTIVVGRGMCSGNGVCMLASSGICDCFVGYDGAACDRCAANWFERNGRCHPRQKQANSQGGIETRVDSRGQEDGSSDNVSQAAVISAGLLGGFLIVILLITVIMAKVVSKRKRGQPRGEGEEEAATVATESDLSNEARSLSTIWRAFLAEIGSPGSGVTPTVDLSMPSPAGIEGEGPSGHARSVSMTESMESTSTVAEELEFHAPTHIKNLSTDTWFTATSRGFSNRTEYFTARESFGSSSQFTASQLSGSLVL